MKRTILACVACAAVLLAIGPVASAAADGDGGASDAAKLCAAMKKADHAAFKAAWGKHAMRDCIRANRGTTTSPAEGAEDLHNAAQGCRAERDADPAGFATTYATNDNDRNAFGKCVSMHAQADDETDDEGADDEGTAPVA
jgi:hypothetical protein